MPMVIRPFSSRWGQLEGRMNDGGSAAADEQAPAAANLEMMCCARAGASCVRTSRAGQAGVQHWHYLHSAARLRFLAAGVDLPRCSQPSLSPLTSHRRIANAEALACRNTGSGCRCVAGEGQCRG